MSLNRVNRGINQINHVIADRFQKVGTHEHDINHHCSDKRHKELDTVPPFVSSILTKVAGLLYGVIKHEAHENMFCFSTI